MNAGSDWLRARIEASENGGGQFVAMLLQYCRRLEGQSFVASMRLGLRREKKSQRRQDAWTQLEDVLRDALSLSELLERIDILIYPEPPPSSPLCIPETHHIRSAQPSSVAYCVASRLIISFRMRNLHRPNLSKPAGAYFLSDRFSFRDSGPTLSRFFIFKHCFSSI